MDIKTDMEDLKKSITTLTESVTKLNHAIEMMKLTSRAENDSRYCQKSELRQDAIAVLSDPDVRERCNEIVNNALETPRCRETLRRIHGDIVTQGRDNMAKWVGFVKLLFGSGGAALLGYVLWAMYQSQCELTRIIQAIGG